MQLIESFYLKYEIYKPRPVKKSYKETCACPLVSLSDFSPPSVYKSHILNRMINTLYTLVIGLQIMMIMMMIIGMEILNVTN